MELATSFHLDPSPAGQPVDTSLDTGQMLDTIGEWVTRFRGLPAPPALERVFKSSEEFEQTVRGELLDEDSLSPNPPKDTDGRREDSGREWVRELQGRWPGLLG